MKKTTPKKKTTSRFKSLTILPGKVRFNIVSIAVLAIVLSVVGYFVVKIFAASPNPYACSAPYPVIAPGSTDASLNRTGQQCVSAVQFAILNNAAEMGIKVGYRSIDGQYLPSTTAPMYLAVVEYQKYLEQTATGSLTANQVRVLNNCFGPFKGNPVPSCGASATPPPSGDPSPDPSPDPVSDPIPDYNFPSDGSTVNTDTTLPTLDQVTLEDVSNASPADIQDIIDTSKSTSSKNTQNVARTFSGKLRLLPPGSMVDSGATQIRYYIDAKQKNIAKKFPFSFSLDTTRLSNKRYILTTVAYAGSDKLDEKSFVLNVKNNLTFWQQLYNLITAPFGG